MDQKEIVVMKQLAGIVQSLALRQGISRDDALMSDLRHVEYQLDSLMFSARHPTIAEWNINPIKLDRGLIVAPSDFYIISEKGKVQEFFTMEEAQKLIVPVLKDTQWRLPTRHDIECIIDELQHKIWDTLHLVGGGYTAHNYERKRTERCGDGPFYLILRSARDEKSYYQPVLCGVDFRLFDGKPRIMVYNHDCGFRVRCVSGQAE